MKKLNRSKLEYIFYHLNLNQTIDFTSAINSRLEYDGTTDDSEGKIIFSASNKPLDYKEIIYIDDLPVLFPVSQCDKWYTIDEKNNLIFHHDILKSAFYLLSGYQEYKNPHFYDNLGRFRYDKSIQHKLGIIHKPVVNDYFEVIMQGIEEFSSIHNLTFERKKYFNPIAFFLSHDIDRVDQYHFWEVLLKIMQWAGLKPTLLNRKDAARLAKDSLFSFLKLKPVSNDFWNFDWLLEQEVKHDIKATYYFLDKEGLHDNSRYRFSEQRIKKLMSTITDLGHEVGLHGTVQSARDLNYMKKCYNRLMENYDRSIVGIRQHYLRFFTPLTAKIQSNTGLKYDTTLAFPGHEGFRNNYCLPFKFFDFEEDKMLDHWEIPLLVMDGTLFYYRKLNYREMFDTTHTLIQNIIKHNGVFSLLWHNSHFDEAEFPGITHFYDEYLKTIMEYKPEALTGNQIISRFE
ncbi:MAG: hypothetical protein GVY19_04005 [Bacteroidetes bacterium]|jgi:hypothetical protein|nr:hypothetical protein [Bacteroidota bacterium]